jgi:predicted porin
VKKFLLSSVAVFALATAGHADEISDIQAQAKQLREQMTKRLADLEKRQKALETQKAAVPTISPVDAMAADLPYKAAVKAKPPENDDICIKGVCVYGNFDMGLLYNQHGNPSSDFIGQNQPVEKASSGSYFGMGSNQFSSSFIGLRGKQEVGDNLYAIFNLQTLFYPNSGMNQNGVGGMASANGLNVAGPLATSNSWGDSSKGGQMFNNAAYFGISSPTYGTFTMGRQSALSSDMIVNYDPLSGSGALSLITNEGISGGGGVTENRIWDNSYEYRVNVGPVRLAAEAQLRNGGNSTIGNAFQGDVGFDYMGLSMDFNGGKIYDAVSSSPLSTVQLQNVTNNQAGTNLGGVPYSIGCSNGCLAGTISDNTVFQVAGRYTIGPWKLFAGFEQVRFNNPDNPLQAGAFGEGGYNIGVVNNKAYQTTRVENIFWAGAKYAVMPTLDIIAAYYGYRQNSFVTVGADNGALVNRGLTIQNASATCSDTSSAGCSGFMNAFSLATDWRFARHFDLYAGVMYSEKGGGLASGYVLTASNPSSTGVANTNGKVSTVDAITGLRYQF